MTAVLEKPKAKAKKQTLPVQRPPSAAPAVPKEDAALFLEVWDLLAEAAETDEHHEYSGESDRLLRIGAMLSRRAAEGEFSSLSTEGTAYDVAACINAARLIPGDVESAARTALIAGAAERLAALTECDAEKVVRVDQHRPSRGLAPSSGSKTFTKEHLNKLNWQAYAHMDCAKSVLFQYAEHADSEEVFALRDLLEVYYVAARSSFDLQQVGSLSDGPLADLSADLSKIINLLYAVNTEDRDDGVLHGVIHLLQTAKRIADGDLGVLE